MSFRTNRSFRGNPTPQAPPKHLSFSCELSMAFPLSLPCSTLKGKASIETFKKFVYERNQIETNIMRHRGDPKAVEIIAEGLLRKFKLNKEYRKGGRGGGGGGGREEWGETEGREKGKRGSQGGGDGNGVGVGVGGGKRKEKVSERGDDFDEVVKNLMLASVGIDQYDKQLKQSENQQAIQQIHHAFQSLSPPKPHPPTQSKPSKSKHSRPPPLPAHTAKNLFLSRIQRKLLKNCSPCKPITSHHKPPKVRKLQTNISKIVDHAQRTKGLRFPSSCNFSDTGAKFSDIGWNPIIYKKQQIKQEQEWELGGGKENDEGFSGVPDKFLRMLKTSKNSFVCEELGGSEKKGRARPKTTQKSRYL